MGLRMGFFKINKFSREIAYWKVKWVYLTQYLVE